MAIYEAVDRFLGIAHEKTRDICKKIMYTPVYFEVLPLTHQQSRLCYVYTGP